LVLVSPPIARPSNDNQRAADFLLEQIGASNPFVEWSAVRPDWMVARARGEGT